LFTHPWIVVVLDAASAYPPPAISAPAITAKIIWAGFRFIGSSLHHPGILGL
jgi:hypothetical protein